MLEMQNKEKREHQVIREEMLARQKPRVKFKTPAKEKVHLDQSISEELNVTPEVFLTEDRRTIVCYHPPPKNYPIEFTKPLTQQVSGRPDPRLAATWRDTMTQEEIEEGKVLREEDPWMWSWNEISKMLEVKLEVVERLLPNTPELQARQDAGREVHMQMSKSKRRDVIALNKWAINKYIKTRPGYVPTPDLLERPRMPRPPRF